MNWLRVCLTLSILLSCPHCLWAVQLDDLNPEKNWRLQSLAITGNDHIHTGQLRQQMLSKTRSWTTPWKAFPRFDPVTFAADMTRLKRFYEMQGYNEAVVSYDLSVDEQHKGIKAQVSIHEGEPTRVRELSLVLQDQSSLDVSLETLRPSLALQEGAIFTGALSAE